MRINMKGVFWAGALMFLALCGGGARADAPVGPGGGADKARIERVFALWGVQESLRGVESLWHAQFDEPIASINVEVQPEAVRRLAALKANLTADALLERMYAAFMSQYDAARLQRMERLLAQPLAQRVHRLETEQGNAPSFFADKARYLDGLKDVPRERLDLLRQLVELSGGSDQIAVVLTRAIELRLIRIEGLDPAEAQRRAAAARPGLRERLDDDALGVFLFIYRDLSDDDLRRYVGLYNDEAMAWGTGLLLLAVRDQLDHLMTELLTLMPVMPEKR